MSLSLQTIVWEIEKLTRGFSKTCIEVSLLGLIYMVDGVNI